MYSPDPGASMSVGRARRTDSSGSAATPSYLSPTTGGVAQRQNSAFGTPVSIDPPGSDDRMLGQVSERLLQAQAGPAGAARDEVDPGRRGEHEAPLHDPGL